MFNYDNYLQAMHKLDNTTRNTRFIQACISGEIEKVRLLLDNKDLKVDMYFKDCQGNDGFRQASLFQHINIVNELLCNYNYKISKRNLNYITKRNENFNGSLEDVLKMIKLKEINFSLNKSLKNSNVKAKKHKI